MSQTNDLESLRLFDRSSETLYLRTGVTLAFFLPMPFHASSEDVARVVDAYLRFIPQGSIKWASVGADSERWSEITPKTFDKCKKLLGAEGVSERELTAFEWGDGDNGGDAPGYGLKVVGNPPDEDLPLEQNLIEMHFPWDYLTSKREAFVAFSRSVAALIPYYSGYAAPTLQWAEAKATMAFAEAAALITRHPGLDVSQNELGRSDLGDKSRGGRWLTFLGPNLIKTLGGRAAIAQAVADAAEVIDAGRGLLLRAGTEPEFGDKDLNIDVPRLRRVVELLEPVTLNEGPIFESYFDDDTFAKAWTSRFAASPSERLH